MNEKYEGRWVREKWTGMREHECVGWNIMFEKKIRRRTTVDCLVTNS
jgi:hypothetical protein